MASLVGVYLYITFIEKKKGSYFMHQPLKQNVFVYFKYQGRALVWGGVGRVSWEMASMITSWSNEM